MPQRAQGDARWVQIETALADYEFAYAIWPVMEDDMTLDTIIGSYPGSLEPGDERYAEARERYPDPELWTRGWAFRSRLIKAAWRSARGHLRAAEA